MDFLGFLLAFLAFIAGDFLIGFLLTAVCIAFIVFLMTIAFIAFIAFIPKRPAISSRRVFLSLTVEEIYIWSEVSYGYSQWIALEGIGKKGHTVDNTECFYIDGDKMHIPCLR